MSLQLAVARARAMKFDPPNTVPDTGIDLKRVVVPITQSDIAQDVPIIGLAEIIEHLEAIELWHEMQMSRLKYQIFQIKEGAKPKADDIIKETGITFMISVRDIKSDRRMSESVIPRHVAMYLCKQLTTLSLPAIGRKFGDRDHTTVLHAVRKMEKLIPTDDLLKLKVKEITGNLHCSLPCVSETPERKDDDIHRQD